MKQGNIIFLNGTSSSGKTTLAKALQQRLDEPYFYMAFDDAFIGLNEWFGRKPERVNQFPIQSLVTGFHHAVAGYSRGGVGVILDHCIARDAGMQECIELFRDSRVILVEVVCSLEALREREKARGNRRVGQAESQVPTFERLRQRYPYDLQVDSSLHSPAECAQMVVALLNDGTFKTSFQKMRECMARGPSVGGERKPSPQP